MDLRYVVLLPFVIVPIGVVIYYLLYQRHLRKALSDPDAARHSSLPEPDSTVGVAAIVVFGIMLFNLTSAINNMSEKISDVCSNIDTIDTANAVYSSYDSFEYMYKQQNSIFVSVVQEWEGTKVSLSVIPKTVNDKTTVTARLGKSSVVLQRGEGAEFTGTLVIKEAENHEYEFIISVETDGVTYSEAIENEGYVQYERYVYEEDEE